MTALPDVPKPDTGPTGEAFRARPRSTHEPRAKAVSTVAKGRVTEVVRMQDTHLIDRMWAISQLSDRQHRAATVLLGLFVRAGLVPKGTMGLNPISEGAEEEDEPGAPAKSALPTLGPPNGPEGETWRDRHRRTMKLLPDRTSEILWDLIYDQKHPGTFWLCTGQIGLDELADSWGIERT